MALSLLIKEEVVTEEEVMVCKVRKEKEEQQNLQWHLILRLSLQSMLIDNELLRNRGASP